MLFCPDRPAKDTQRVFDSDAREACTRQVFLVPTARTRATYRFWHITRSCAGRQGYARPRGTLIVFFFAPNAALIRCFARERKIPTAKLAVGDKVKDSAVPPRLTRHRCRTHSSTANTVRLLTRALRPRLLVAFRLGPPGPILSGSVSVGITPPPTLSESVTRFLPVNGFQVVFMLSPHFPRVNGF